MGAGELRDRITVTRSAKVSNGRGGTTSAVQTIASAVPAKIVVRKGGEQVQAQRVSNVTPHDIIVRYDTTTAAISTTDVLTDQNGTVYAIQWAGSLDEGRKQWLTIMATTGTVANR